MALCTDAEVQRLLPLVSPQRRETALRYKHTFGQWASLRSWLMLRELGLPDEPWQYNEYGKPYIPNGPHFSISHCKQGIAVAVDEQPVGIDIESYRDITPELIAYTMSEAEQEQINAAQDPIKAFTEGDMKGTNVILPLVSTDLNDLLNYIKPFEDAGYNVKAKLREAVPNESMARVFARTLEGGQLINPDFIFSVTTEPEEVYYELAPMINARGETYGYDVEEALEPAA